MSADLRFVYTGAEILYAEDPQDGQEIGSLQIVNPFRHTT